MKKELQEINAKLDKIIAALGAPAAGRARRRNIFSYRVMGGFKSQDVREMVIQLRRDGVTFNDIVQEIKNRWPDNPEKHVSHSGAHRFYISARAGLLKEYGIEPF